jgi:hypothetical protein
MNIFEGHRPANPVPPYLGVPKEEIPKAIPVDIETGELVLPPLPTLEDQLDNAIFGYASWPLAIASIVSMIVLYVLKRYLTRNAK